MRDIARHSIFMVLTKLYSTCLYSGPTGVTRRQFLVNVLLDVMVQDTGFTVRVLVSKKNPFVYCNFYPSATRYQKSHGGQMIGIMHWNLVLCSFLGRGHCVVFLGKALTVPLSNQCIE